MDEIRLFGKLDGFCISNWGDRVGHNEQSVIGRQPYASVYELKELTKKTLGVFAKGLFLIVFASFL